MKESQDRKKSKWLTGGLAFTLAMSTILSACSSSNTGSNTGSSGQETGGEASKGSAGEGPVTISMMYNDNPSYPFNASWPVLEQFQKLANVKLNIQPTPDADYENKLKIVLSSGSAPDLVSFVPLKVYTEFAQTGVLLPISDYMDKLPNLKQKLDQYAISDELDNWTLKDGKVYGVPFMFESNMYTTAPVIRVDLLKKHNLKTPTTMDELYEVLKKFKEADPKSFPMANLNGAVGLINLSGSAWGIGPTHNGFMFNSDKNEFEYSYTSDNYKQYVSYFSRLMKEGLADPEIFTSSTDQWKQKMATGQSVFTYTWISELGQINADGKKNVSPDFELAPLPPIAGPGGVKGPSAQRIISAYVIPASAAKKPNFDKLLEYVNWMYSDEAINLGTWGIQDETFVEIDGKRDFTDAVKNGGSVQKALWNIGASNNNLTTVFTYDWFSKVLNSPLVDKLTVEANEKGWFPAVQKVPKLTPADKEEETMRTTTVNDLFMRTQEQFIYGKNSVDAGWDSYVKEINEKGVSKLLEIYNGTLK
ncbi:extracellular solute-binding protein [Cohnella sp. WQ 127256]|uniref:extracellular solute-binding protein n=1 Tax=Cohnella sp. WQ 127256 TaxID=2938790 RepID=UPI0021193B26|nr:extracellular solute-binding protein [Cohnella sp. WQ 127256]